jgi:hypothetical protein
MRGIMVQENSLFYPVTVLIVLGTAAVIIGAVSFIYPVTVERISTSGDETTSPLFTLYANTNYKLKIQVQWLELARGSGTLVIHDESQSVILSLVLSFNSEEGRGMAMDISVPRTGQYYMTYHQESVEATDPFYIWVHEKSFIGIPSEILLSSGILFFLTGLVLLVFLEFIEHSSPRFSRFLKAGEKTLKILIAVLVLNLVLVLIVTAVAAFTVPGYFEELAGLPLFLFVYGLTLPISAPFLSLAALGALGFLFLVTITIVMSRNYLNKQLGWDEMDEKRYLLISCTFTYWIPVLAYLSLFYVRNVIDLSVFSYSKILKDPFNLMKALPGLGKLFSAWWFFGLMLPLLLTPVPILWYYLRKTTVNNVSL